MITSEAEGLASFYWEQEEILSMSGRPAVVTLLRGLYLWNRKPAWQAVFFGGFHHPFYRVWDQYWIMASGACRQEGVTTFPPAVSR